MEWSCECILSATNILEPTLTIAYSRKLIEMTIDLVDVNGCPGTATKNVVIHPKPTASITPVADICHNADPVTVTAVPSETGGTGVWTGATKSTASDLNAIFTPATVGANALSFTYTSQYGCIADPAPATIQVIGIETLEINYSPSEACEYENALTATLSHDLGGTVSNERSLTINPPTSAFNASTGAFTPSANAVGSYIVTYSGTVSGCTAISDDAIIKINPRPVIDISHNKATFCQGATTVPLTAKLAGTNSFITGSTGAFSGPGVSNDELDLMSGSITTNTPFTVTYSGYADPSTGL
jgi:hypothetical protein